MKLQKTTMTSLLGGSASAEQAGGAGKGLAVDMEDEDDLFEINLEAVDSIPSPHYHWDSYFTTTGNALLANCLLPVTDISRAIPTVSKALSSEGTGNVVMVQEAVPLGQLLGLPFLGAFGLHQKEVKPKWNLIGKNEAHLDVESQPFEGRRYYTSVVDTMREDIKIYGG